MASRARIAYKSFTCPGGHEFRALVTGCLRDDDHYEESFQPIGLDALLPIPKCPAPECMFIGIETSDLRASDLQQVPSSECFEGWLSPDGARLSVPGYAGAQMPIRYQRAGYIRVQARNLQDLDRLDAIRSKQTGNECGNIMNHSSARRRLHDEADPSDDPCNEL